VVTSQYERQISLIQERLSGIESSLKSLTRGSTISTPIPKPEINNPPTQSNKSISIFEGESSFGSQTIQAGQLANVTATTVAGVPSSELSNALSLLKDSLKRHEALSRTHETHLSTRIKLNAVDQQELPPAPLVIALIKTAKGVPPVSIGYAHTKVIQ
jgi:hypothetical protein